MDLTRIDTIVQFSQGTSAWSNINVPVPAGVVVIDTDNKVIKEGDGATLFASLPVCLDYNFHSSTSGAVEPVGDDVGYLVTADDSMYAVGSTKLTDILTSITSKAATDVTQETRITDLTNQLGIIEVIAEGVVDGTIVVCSNGKYIPGDRTLAQLIADLIAQANVAETGMHIDDLEWYTDSGLTNKVVKPNQVTEQNTYWCKITGFHDNAELSNVDFGLATTNSSVTITNSAKEITSALIAAVYGSTGEDKFMGVIIDSNDNIICCGYTNSEGSGVGYEAIIVKFDKNMEIIARKRYGGVNNDYFFNVITDSNDNIICVGQTQSEGVGSNVLVVKFDPSLNIIARKHYGGSLEDNFEAIITDSNDNIICTGYTKSEGTNTNGLVIKFDSSLNIVARKHYGGSGGEDFCGVTVDRNNNIICVGYTDSEGSGSYDALIVKFDSSLNIIARKRYGGISDDHFLKVTTDSTNNIICVGVSQSEGIGSTTYTNALVVKFDPSLNIIARKVYGGSLSDYFYDVAIDSNNNIICVGYTSSEGYGVQDALIVKFDSSLNLITQKRYGGTGIDMFYGITTDSNNNIICVGYTSSEGSAGNNAVIIKLPKDIPSGTVVGTILTGLTLIDVTSLTLADSTLTLANSALTLADSALTLANSTLILSTSILTLEKDILVAGRYTEPTELITTIYSSAFVDEFKATAIDSSDNIFAVGLTTISGVQHALIVKLDSSFNTLVRKLYTGQYSDNFNSVAIDSENNVIAVGKYITASGGYTEAFIVKFSNDLSSVISHKTYGATGDDVFNDITVGASNNYYVCGYTTSEGQGLKEGLVVKFNSSLAILYKKRYGGTGNDVLNGITMDAVGNAICVGSTSSEGANTSGLVLKLDTNLNIVLRKYYNSTLGTTTEFNAVVTTAANITYCVGRVVMASGNKGLIVKYDSSLNVTGNKLYGNTVGSTEFTGVGLDSSGNVFVAGKTNAEGAGNFDALIMKFDSTLAIKGRKTYGTIGEDADIDCTILDDDVVLSGYSVIKGSTDAVITKLPNGLPVGTYTNKYFTDLILSDSKLILSDDNGTGVSSTLAMSDSALVLTNGTMVLENAPGAVVRDVTIMDAVSNVFKVQFGNVVDTEASVNIPFVVTTNDGDETLSKNISIDAVPANIVAAVYGGSANDYFRSVATDSNDNIICVGYTNSEGVNSDEALIVKFDSSLNIIGRKIYSGGVSDYFWGVYTDSNDNIICVGYTNSEGSGNNDALVIKFDPSLNIIARKRYGGSGNDYFYDTIVDSHDNIICVGHTYSEGSGNDDALVVKFDPSLNIIARKRYGGSGNDMFYGINIDSSDNIICVGFTGSEGSGNIALVVKFDTLFNIVARKRYGVTGTDNRFQKVVIDSNDNIICVGHTSAEGSGNNDALIVKFDSSLNIIARKRYGGSVNDYFRSVATDSNDNIICVGYTNSEGVNSDEALIVKFDSSLNIIGRKIYSGGVSDYFYNVITDLNNNIICVGNTNSEGSGNNDALVIKFPSNLPSGTLVGTTLTNLSLNDSTLTIADSTLTLADSALTLANSTLTLANSTLTLADSTLTLEKDTIMI